jgi:hypothetical protein
MASTPTTATPCRSPRDRPTPARFWPLVRLIVPLVAGFGTAHAQAPEPSARPVSNRPLSRTPALAAALTAGDGMDRAVAVRHILPATRFNVLVASPRLLTWLAANDSTSQMAERCRRAWDQGSRAAGRATVPQPWEAFDSAAAGAALIVIQISPIVGPAPACASNADREPSVVARGVALTASRTYTAERDVRYATALIGGRAIEPVLYGRVPVPQLAPAMGTESTNTAMQVRLYLAADDIRPDTLGRFPPLEIRVRTADTPSTTAIFVQPETIRETWYAMLAWRLTRTAGAGARPSTVVALPLPDDVTLRLAHERHHTGDAVDAALLSERRLRSGQLSERDERFASMQIGTTLLQHHDTTGARVLLADVLKNAPCLTLSSTAPREFHRLLTQMRPRARCTTVSTGLLALRGVVFPGLAQLSSGRRDAAVGFGGVTLAVLGTAAFLHSRAESRYAKYMATSDSRATEVLYSQATHLRNNALHVAIAGGAIWAAALVEAVVSETQHARRIGLVRDYGARPLLRSGARNGRDVVGIGIALSF